jgi:single-stranded DNA-binding protein
MGKHVENEIVEAVPDASPSGRNRLQSRGADDQDADSTDVNLVLVQGTITGEPELRTLPSGSQVLDLSVRVRKPGSKTTSLPVAWHDPPKRATQWGSGDAIVVTGSVVRRFFRGRSGLGSSTEVIVTHGELVRHQGKAARVVQRAANAVASVARP